MKGVLESGYIRLGHDGSRIVSLNLDPTGGGRRSIDFVKDLRPEFWHETPDTRIATSCDESRQSVRFFPLEIWETSQIVTPGTHTPVELMPGHTLSHTFTIPPNTRFDSVAVRLPTWNTTSSGATLSLYQADKLLVTRRLENVVDNSWESLKLEESLDEGEYKIILSEPVGRIGWWSVSEDGDRAVNINARRFIGTGDLTYTLQRNRLTVEAAIHPRAKSAHTGCPWRWKTTWTKDGYDCSPESGTVFSRFFTDNQRYMPIEQLKRRNTGGLSFRGFRRLEMDGTRDADIRLEGMNYLHWEMRPDELHLRLDSPYVEEDGLLKTRWSLVVKQRVDSLPASFPRFSCSDKTVEADLNRFWWDRAFTYGAPPNRCIEFSEWMALMRSWYDGPQRDGEIRHLLNYPMTDEGYVHTYGDIVGWPLVPNRDTRHFDTNARFILACWRHYLWTGDLDFLRRQADRLREAMRFQLEDLRGEEGLIVTPEFRTGRHEDLSNNYWDILPFGHLDAYANAVFYGSLKAMAAIEGELSGKSEIRKAKCETNAPEFYRSLAEKAHQRYDEVFWDEYKGRYIGCVDIDGVRHDYGFTFVNLEALYYGLGDSQKAARIYRWMETEPTSSGEADTYSKWILAPRSTTIHNPPWQKSDESTISHTPSTISPWWTYWWKGAPYGDQCQDGGAILYTSFFDLMNRVEYKGPDDAWRRFTEILDRYRMPDRLCGGSPLYRGETSQQESAGAVGVDYPFPESGLVPCYFLYGVIGIEARPEGLRITPRLPKSLTYAGVDYIHWQGMRLKVRVTADSVKVTGKSFTREFAIGPGGSVLLTRSDLR